MKSPRHKKRSTPYMSRNEKNPMIAYNIFPESVAPTDTTATIYMGKEGQIGIKLQPEGGHFKVRKTSRRASTRRLNVPKEIVPMIPMGTHEISLRPVGFLLVVEITSQST